MIKLNKNQKLFFEKAIVYFDNRANCLKLKDIRKFAEDNSLIVPISALKNHCVIENKRGFYDLTKVGIIADNSVISTNTVFHKDFVCNHDNLIKEVNVFADPKHIVNTEVHTIEDVVTIKLNTPLFLICDGSEGKFDENLLYIHLSLKGAYSNMWNIFHSKPIKSFKQVEDDINESEYSFLKSNNCGMCCYIIKKQNIYK